MKTVALSSGGLDSSLMMLILKNEGHEIYPLHIDYGQLAEEREWFSCSEVSNFIGVNTPRKVDIHGLEFIKSGLINKNLDIVSDAFFPTRNLLFLTFGAAYAVSLDARVVSIGILSNPIFPDQSGESIKLAKNSISASLGSEVEVVAPFIDLDKRDVIKLAMKLGLPFELTYYCHAGEEKPCGKCISCQERKMAERALDEEGLNDSQ